MNVAELCALLADVRSRIPFQARPIFSDGSSGDWSSWLITPAAGYLESMSEGPYRASDLSSIEIDPVEIIQTGKYAKDILIDHRQEILAELAAAHDRIEELSVGLFRIRFD